MNWKLLRNKIFIYGPTILGVLINMAWIACLFLVARYFILMCCT